VIDTLHPRRADAPEERGFMARDLIRFLAVDIIIVFCLRLLLWLGFFSGPDSYVLTILASKLALFAYLVWLVKEHRDAWAATGIRSAGKWWAWPASLGLYVVGYPLMVGVTGLSHKLMAWLYSLAGWVYVPEAQDVMLLIFENIVNAPVRAILVLFAVLGGPFMEELAFRGMGYDGFRRAGGAVSALIWTSVLFGLYHFSLPQLLPLVFLGALFGAVRILSRSLWCSIAIHCLHNGLVLFLAAREMGWPVL
jgi:membrane protease YdiL (CAAX protease family)